MALASRLLRWPETKLPKGVFVVLTIFGIGFIWIAKIKGVSASLTITVPVALMFIYFMMSVFLTGLRIHDEQAGDNLYYMGFLFT